MAEIQDTVKKSEDSDYQKQLKKEKNEQLYYAAKEGRLNDVIQLISEGADPSWMNPDNMRWTPLHVTNTAAIATVFVKAQANVNAIDVLARTPLHVAETAAIAEVLLKAQANVNAINKDGNSCLHTSSIRSDSSLVQYLISMISVDTLNNNGQTPLFMAVQNPYDAEEVVSLLLKEGARADIIDNNGQCVLHYTKEPVVAEMVITAGAQIDTIDKSGNNCLHSSCKRRFTDPGLISFFMSKGVFDINATNHAGQTPVYLASQYGNMGAVDCLVEKRADYTIPDNNGITPLQLLQSDGQEFAKENNYDAYDINNGRRDCLIMLKYKHSIVPTKDNDESSSATNIQYNETDSVQSIPDDISVHVKAFKNAVQSKGSLTCHIVQLTPFGPPRAGKTCLRQRLVDEAIPGTPTTSTTVGSGSLSTDVLSESQMIQIKMKMDDNIGSSVSIIAEEDGKWSLVKTLQDEIAICFKSLEHQTKHKTSSEHDVQSLKSDKLHSPESVDDQPNTKNTSHTATNDTSEYNTSSSKHVSSSLLDDAVINTITRYIKEKNVDLSQVQLLLDKSTTIFYTDTGGQPEFQEVLPALTAGPTIFLLVFGLHQPLDSKYEVLYETSSKTHKLSDSSFTVREALMQCLSSISSYHISQTCDFPANQLKECAAPPTHVVSVATHRDLVSEEVYTEVDKDFKQSIDQATNDNDSLMEPFEEDGHLVIPINNYNPEDGKKVRKVIERIIKRKVNGVSPYKVELPAHWLGFQIYLRQYDSSTITYSVGMFENF